MKLKERIEAGVKGEFKGLENGFNRINDYIYGIQRNCYYLLGGLSGTYKTTMADYMVLNAIQDAEAKGLELNVYYYSFEIDKLTKQCNWLSNIIYNKYDVTISPERIKGFSRDKLTAEELELVYSEVDYVEGLFKKIKFTFNTNNPTGVYKDILKDLNNRGTFSYKKYKDASGKEISSLSGYTPDNPLSYNLLVMDHVFLLHKERGWATKETIDKMSEFFVGLRNMCGFSIIALQQFNQGLNAVDRQKHKGVDLSPSQNDFRDSTVPYTDADVVLGLMSPFKMDLEKSLGYNISKVRDKMIMFKIIKNRLSKDNVAIGLYCNPKAGSFKELPSAKQITDDIYDKIKNDEY